ncbi:MAG: hypothetical protein Q9191_004776 [Dirinaria sp. TL-2023a]
MSSVTANWYLDDEEYFLKTEDYTIPCGSAKVTRCEIDEGNKYPFPPSEKLPNPRYPFYFSDALQEHMHRMVYRFVSAGALIYADVDDANPNHFKEVKELQGHEKLETESEATKAALDALVAHFMNDEEFKNHWAEGHFEHNGEKVEDPEAIQNARKHSVEQWLKYEVVYPKVLNSQIVNYMAGPGHDHSEELLNIISEQDHLKNKRPLMIVHDIIDSYQEPENFTKRGWVSGFDIVKNELIIKPFFSDKTHHPLGSSWSAETPDDGVSGRWTPLEFVQAYIQLAQSVKDQIANQTIAEVPSKAHHSQPDLQLPDQALGFRMYVHTMVARTFFQLWHGLVEYHSSTPDEAAALKSDAQEAYDNIEAYLTRIPFTAVPKNELPEVPVVAPVLALERGLVELEDYYRRTAIALKEFHKEEQMGENTRLFYERIYGMVKAFNKDPKGVNVAEL